MSDDPSEQDLHRTDDARSPRHSRTSVLLKANIEPVGNQSATEHSVRDIAPGGIRVDNAAELEPGLAVFVSIGALQRIAAKVVWVRDGFAGLAFAQDLDP